MQRKRGTLHMTGGGGVGLLVTRTGQCTKTATRTVRPPSRGHRDHAAETMHGRLAKSRHKPPRPGPMSRAASRRGAAVPLREPLRRPREGCVLPVSAKWGRLLQVLSLGESWLLRRRVSGFRFARGCGSACGAVRTTRAEASPIGGPVQGQPPKAPPPDRCHGNSNRQISENRGRTLLR